MQVMARYTAVLALLCLSLVAGAKSNDASKALDAARRGDSTGLAALLDRGADINAVEAGSGQTLLMAATLAGQAGVVDLLLSRGADPKIGEHQGYTPPHGAGFQGRAAVVPVLARHGIDLAHVHEDGFSGYHRALWGGEPRHTETVAAFLDAGVDVNQRSRDGRHPLEITRNANSRDLLLARGADLGQAPRKAAGGEL